MHEHSIWLADSVLLLVDGNVSGRPVSCFVCRFMNSLGTMHVLKYVTKFGVVVWMISVAVCCSTSNCTSSVTYASRCSPNTARITAFRALSLCPRVCCSWRLQFSRRWHVHVRQWQFGKAFSMALVRSRSSSILNTGKWSQSPSAVAMCLK